MPPIIYLVIGIVVGFVIAKNWNKQKTQDAPPTTPKIINPEQIKQRQEHLGKVLEMVKDKGEIANDDVEKALGVSDSTAQRYLQELEGEGKLQQIGQRGKYVIYKAQ